MHALLLDRPPGPALAHGTVLPASPVVVAAGCTIPITRLPGGTRACSEVALFAVGLVPIVADRALPVTWLPPVRRHIDTSTPIVAAAAAYLHTPGQLGIALLDGILQPLVAMRG